MAYAVSILEDAAKALASLPRFERDNVRDRIDSLQNDPRPSWARMLRGPARYWRFRVGDYRVIYRIADSPQEVVVVEVGHRSRVYRDLG